MMERPRADLRLDSGGAKRSERVVSALELDDVRLPAVAVALGGARCQHVVLEPLRVPACDPLASRQQLLEPGELRDADRRREDPAVGS